MRRIALAVIGTVTGLVMLLSFKTHATSTASVPALVGPVTPSGSDPTSSTASGPAAASSSTAARPSSAPSTSTPASTTRTVTGDAVDTRYGPVQVRITVAGGRITDAQAIEYPRESGRDVRINSEAVPELNQEALQAQSAQIDTVSGATYTSEGYQQSLQSAIDQAHR